MNYGNALALAIKKQGFDLNVGEIPLNIFLKNTHDILTLCFLEEESEDYIIVVETNDLGAEEIRIIPKDNIEYIGIFYDFEDESEEVVDRMII